MVTALALLRKEDNACAPATQLFAGCLSLFNPTRPTSRQQPLASWGSGAASSPLCPRFQSYWVVRINLDT